MYRRIVGTTEVVCGTLLAIVPGGVCVGFCFSIIVQLYRKLIMITMVKN